MQMEKQRKNLRKKRGSSTPTSTNFKPSQICTFARGSVNPVDIPGKNFFET
jgi:hypothetical protein